jgi:hypothetical protein
MHENFLQLINKAKTDGDSKKEQFLEYLMSKYLVDLNFFVPMIEVAPLLDPLDLEELKEILYQ